MTQPAAFSGAATRPRTADVPESRWRRLTRGINLSHWFAQAHSYDRAHLRGYITAEDMALIRQMGFVHVRFTLNPAILLDRAAPERLNADALAEVDRALDLILAHDLAVIVDLHPEDDFKHWLAGADEAVIIFARFWRALATHLARRDPEWVVLEVLNEPVMADGDRWQAIQRQALTAMREGAPAHTLIATAHRWSSLPELLQLEPVLDPNVVYTFHCYDPHIFTHQSATWSMSFLPHLRHLPYPSSPELLAPLLPRIADERARAAARDYGEERWNAERLTAWLAQAADWAARHNTRLTCNEFGVYRLGALPEHRLAWLRDVRATLERFDIGWAMWDYAGGFSVVLNEDGRRVPDQATLAALGLA
jgi:endoglucanase